jgi:ribosome maturation protein SDO1
MPEYGSPKGNFDLGKFIIVKIVKGKYKFEMVADPTVAHRAKKVLQEFRQEKKDQEITAEDVLHLKDIDLNDVFPTFDIFKDLKKGDRCTEEDLLETFETTEGRTVAAHFMLEGDFAWTQDQRDKWLEKKRKQIITILARNSINPQTKKPHPPKRIEKAMDETKVSIDLNKTAEEQVDDILKKIQLVLPIRMEALKMAVKVPAQYAAKAYNLVERYAHVQNSEWQTDGSWIGAITLPAGLQMEMLDKLNKMTHGRVQSKLLQN